MPRRVGSEIMVILGLYLARQASESGCMWQSDCEDIVHPRKVSDVAIFTRIHIALAKLRAMKSWDYRLIQQSF
jgi:hypothetical protein